MKARAWAECLRTDTVADAPRRSPRKRKRQQKAAAVSVGRQRQQNHSKGQQTIKRF